MKGRVVRGGLVLVAVLCLAGLVIAGLSTGAYASDNVSVEMEDFSGFSSTDNEDHSGQHTTHIVPVSGLIQGYKPGDIVSGETAGATEQFEFEVADQPVPMPVEAEDVNILSPDLFDVGTPGLFNRGDIVPIELELIGGNAATVTFGDIEEQNAEVHATVFDPTYTAADVANNADTTVTVYLNTYQIGQGYVENASADTLDLQPNRPDWIAHSNFVNRNHGFFTDPADSGSALLDASALPRSQNVYATNTTNGSIDIYGGSQGGAVLSPGDISDGPAGEFPGLRYNLHAAGNLSPYTTIGDTREDGRDDVNALDIKQRSTDEFNFWTAPGDGPNELSVGDALDTKIVDIQSLIAAGIITELETTTDENGNVVFTDSVTENDFIIVQAQSTGLEGVMHEGVLREGLSVADFLDRSEDHVYTDALTETTNQTLPRDIPGEPNNRLIDLELELIETFSSYQDRLADAEPNEELVTPERIEPDLDIEAVIADLNDDGNLAEYYLTYRVDEDLPVRTGVDTLTPSLTFDANTTLEPRGGEQQLNDTAFAGDRSVPRDVNPYLSTNSLGPTESSQLDYVLDVGLPPDPTTGIVIGQVVTQADAALANATLEFVADGADTPERIVTTNDEGTYAVELPADTTYEVTAFADGLLEMAAVTVEQNTTHTVALTITPDIPPLPGYDSAPRDLDGDSLFEDVDGSREFTIFDVQAFFINFEEQRVQNNPAAFNFKDAENPEETGVTIFDVQALFVELAG